MPPAALENRRDVRIPADDQGFDLDPFAPIRVLDLDAGSVVVETEAWLAPGGRYPVCLGPNIRLTGVVTRCALRRVKQTRLGERRIYRTGIRFDAPSPDAGGQLHELMHQIAALGPAEPLPTALLFG